MEFINQCISLFLHLDTHLSAVIASFGMWTYALLFLIIFCETGLVVTPFLPGDSLLFALGALAAQNTLNLPVLLILLSVAAILGNMLNYSVGHFLGPKVLGRKKLKFIKQEYLNRTHQFFEKYGGKTIILTRFVPIIRTFAPFLAGVGLMPYLKFLAYNVIGGTLWVVSFLLLGYFFGNLAVVQKNFSLVILAIIVISMIPAAVEFLRARSQQLK